MIDLATALAIKDPALATRWMLRLPNTSDITLYIAETVEATFPKINSTPRYTGGTNKYYPGINDTDAINVQFYETYDFEVTRYIDRWRKRIVRPDGTYGLPVQYKAPIYADMYYPQRDVPVLSVLFEGCWPSDQTPFSLTYEDDVALIQVGITFVVDDAKIITDNRD